MSITVDTSTPAPVSAGTAISLSSVPANSLIVLGYSNVDSTGATSITSITDTSSGGPLTWTKLAFQSRFAVITSEVWVASCPSAQASLTITLTLAGTCPSTGGLITAVVLNGAASSQTGAIKQTIGGTGAITGTLTTTAANSWVFGAYCTHETTAPTPDTGQTLTFNSQVMQGNPGSDYCWMQATTSPTSSSGTVVTLDDTAPAGTAGWVGVMVEILAGAGAPPVVLPPRIPTNWAAVQRSLR